MDAVHKSPELAPRRNDGRAQDTITVTFHPLKNVLIMECYNFKQMRENFKLKSD